jgi:hypothetical protein
MLGEHERLWSQPVSHSIAGITPNDKTIEVRVILLEKLTNIELKNGDKITQFLVADNTGCIKCNFFGEQGNQLTAGDILFLGNIYASLYKEQILTLYTGRKSPVRKIGAFYFHFSEELNMSDTVWERIGGLYQRVT